MRSLKCFLLFSILATEPAFADTLHMTESGSFSGTTPSTTSSAPGGTFSYTFDVASNPFAVGQTSISFNTVLTNVSYILNFVTTVLPSVVATFFNESSGGFYNLCLSNASCSSGEVLSLFGNSQLYSGTLAAPNILTGSFTPNGEELFVNGNPYNLASASPVSSTLTLTLTTTP